MREFAAFWQDEKDQHTCCERATDEELEQQAEVFDCETCPIRQQLQGLDADNAEAWRLFHAAFTRLTVEWRLAGLALDRLLGPLDAEDFDPMLARLSLIYDTLYPESSGPDGPHD